MTSETNQYDKRWELIRDIKKAVDSAIEHKRKHGGFPDRAYAEAEIYLEKDDALSVAGANLVEYCLVAAAKVFPLSRSPDEAFMCDNIGVTIRLARGLKCARCWRITEEVGQCIEYQEFCFRCAHVVNEHYHELAGSPYHEVLHLVDDRYLFEGVANDDFWRTPESHAAEYDMKRLGNKIKGNP